MDYGLIGGLLGYSYSKMIHEQLGLCSYENYVVTPDGLEDFIKKTNLKGFNVTAPHKENIIKYLADLSPLAKRIGSVNTVVRRNGKLIGYNTDYYGLKYALEKTGVTVKDKSVLILGSGGTMKTARCLFEDLGAKKITVVSRGGPINYQNVYDQTDTQVVVNTTPVGTHPRGEDVLVDLKKFPRLEGVFDVVYNPLMTRLLFDAHLLGVKYGGGIRMLVAQAVFAEEIFLDKSIDKNIIEKTVRRLIKEIKNIVLVGMPGSGKTTLGKMIAKIKNMPLIDTDAEICRENAMTVEEIFNKFSEEGFRKMERVALLKAAQQRGVVIATGGGVVKDEKNKFPLWQNGTVYYIDRDLSLLETEGRPLSSAEKNVALYKERHGLYLDFAHVTVKNDSLEKALEEILNYEDTRY